ncbi:hypothetical protein IMCC9480_1562 [Oxalobacteraceae bacterium IMCC9480]|nr:hypothetical protein IMCC9480_1562 [Oxalobacteraceae bacterium IMCC9480]
MNSDARFVDDGLTASKLWRLAACAGGKRIVDWIHGMVMEV